MCLELSLGLFRIRLGAPGPAFFLELSRLHDEAVGDADNLSFCDRLARCGCVIHALIQPRAEALEGLVSIAGIPKLLDVVCKVRCQYPGIFSI